MRRTLTPSQELQLEVDALLERSVEGAPHELLTRLAQLGARLVLQRAVEEECDEFLGRLRYERRPGALPGYRNGYRPRRLRSGEGPIEVLIPQVRNACEPFVSKLFPRGARFLRTEPLKAMVIGGYVRGLSCRDVADLCREAGLGAVSKTTVSVLNRELRARYAAWRSRDLSQLRLVALFLDAIYLRVRPHGGREGVLLAWGITEQGKRVLLELALGHRESADDWLSLGRGLARRGLRDPLLVVADGAPGLIRAIEELWPKADRQRCTVHRARNLYAKIPDKRVEPKLRAAYQRALNEASSFADGKRRMQALIAQLQDQGFERAAACLADDLDALLCHLRYPLRQRIRWRSTNMLERTLGEVRRRTKVIGCFPGESSCLTLCWAVLDLIYSHSTSINFTDLEQQQFRRLRAERERKPELTSRKEAALT